MVRSSNSKSDFDGNITYDNPNPEYFTWIMSEVHIHVHTCMRMCPFAHVDWFHNCAAINNHSKITRLQTDLKEDTNTSNCAVSHHPNISSTSNPAKQ
jgi:hypothetical protein